VAHFEAIKVLPEILTWVIDMVNMARSVSFPCAIPSERLRGDHARESVVEDRRGNVRMLSPERVG
jgi:hypothetical protein